LHKTLHVRIGDPVVGKWVPTETV